MKKSKHNIAVNPDQSLRRRSNMRKVLQLIRDEGPVTRADIADKTGLSAPTISRFIDILSKKGLLLFDEPGASMGGRRPQLLRFDSKSNYVIGIDIGGTCIRAALSNLDGEFLYEIHVSTEIRSGFGGVMKQVGELIQKLQSRAASKQRNIFGIGVAVCGIVNRHSGIVDYSPVFGWQAADVKKALMAYTSLEIAMGNVTHLIALGELLFGKGRDYDHFIALNLGFGIGAGIIINGRPFYGADGHTGEIGHIVVDPRSDRMGRENIRGTMEAMASGYGIAEIFAGLMESGRQSMLPDAGDADIDAKKIMQAAMAGDTLATEVIDAAAEYAGIGIDSLIKLFNPQAIFLSGGISLSGNFFTDKIQSRVQSLALPFSSREVPILLSSFGEDAALMGAFSLILEKILSLDHIS